MTVDGMEIDINPVHPSKTDLRMVVIALGIEIVVNAMHNSNAPSPIDVTLFGIVIDSKLLLLIKA